MKKKFVSLLLAAALVFSLGVPAFAEGAEALPAEPEAAVAEAEPEMAPEDETNEVVVTLGDTVTATTTTEQAPAADTKTTAPAAEARKKLLPTRRARSRSRSPTLPWATASWQAWAWPMSSTAPTALPLTAWT